MANGLVFRVLVLAGVVLLAGYWLSTHAPFGGPVVTLVTSVLGMATTILGLVSATQNARLERLAKGRLVGLVQTALAPGVLTVLALFVLLVGFTCSTVTVRAESPGTALAVSLDGGETQTLDADTPAVSFFRLTTPFGRAVRLKVDGYVPRTVEVAPWSGTQVDVADLAPTPTLLLRVPEIKSESIKNGRFVVTLPGKRPRTIAVVGKVAAVLLGPPRAIPNASRQRWLLELESQGVPPVRKAAAVVAWTSHASGAEIGEIPPGVRLHVKFLNTSDSLIAEREFEVGSAPFQDVLLEGRDP